MNPSALALLPESGSRGAAGVALPGSPRRGAGPARVQLPPLRPSCPLLSLAARGRRRHTPSPAVTLLLSRTWQLLLPSREALFLRLLVTPPRGRWPASLSQAAQDSFPEVSVLSPLPLPPPPPEPGLERLPGEGASEKGAGRLSQTSGSEPGFQSSSYQPCDSGQATSLRWPLVSSFIGNNNHPLHWTVARLTREGALGILSPGLGTQEPDTASLLTVVIATSSERLRGTLHTYSLSKL